MKIFLIVSCLLAAAAAIETEDLNKLTEAWKDPLIKCAQENGYSGLTLQQIYGQEEKSDVDKTTCLHACVLRSLGVLKFSQLDGQKLGKYFENIFLGQPIKAMELTQVALRCIAKVANIRDECKMAHLYSQCYLNSH